MDNNLAERCLRPGALGRMSCYGTHSEWSGNLLAASMSILQTAAKHNLNAEAYLRYYLDACAKEGGLQRIWNGSCPGRFRTGLSGSTILGGSILADFPLTVCGRSLIIDDIEMIRRIIASDPKATRVRISREVCRAWSWFKPDGGLKDMSCRVLLLRLHRCGMITLPEPRRSNANGRKFSRRTKHGEAGKEISGPLKSLLPLELIRVTSKKDSYLWNEFIDRYHYLGYTPLPGAQIRYLINSPAGYLCAIGFSAAAWKVAQKGYLYRLER